MAAPLEDIGNIVDLATLMGIDLLEDETPSEHACPPPTQPGNGLQDVSNEENIGMFNIDKENSVVFGENEDNPEFSNAEDANGKYTCDMCGKEFSRKDNLIVHMRLHSGELFRCSRCPAAMTTKYRIARHIENVHGQVRQICSDCGSSFKSTSALKAHKKLHEDVPSFLCPFCAKAFAYKSSFDGHLASHTGDKPFKCDCGAEYTHASGLSHHRNSCVNNQTPVVHKCTTCGKTLKHQRYLREHEKLHGEPSYQCSHCGETFHQRGALIKHTQRKH